MIWGILRYCHEDMNNNSKYEIFHPALNSHLIFLTIANLFDGLAKEETFVEIILKPIHKKPITTVKQQKIK